MNCIYLPKKQIPIKRKFDTLVAGGGIAGISAALAAARHGASVILIESQYLLGGLATAGLVTIYLPLCDGLGRQVSFGIAEELLRLSVKHGYEAKECDVWLKNTSVEERKKKRFETQYNPYVFAILAEKLLKENGVTLLYGSQVSDTVVENGKIKYVLAETPSGKEGIEVKNVVDATGDADICRLSKEDTVNFKQGNIPAAWYYSTVNGENRLVPLGCSDIPDSQKTDEQLERDKSSLRFSGLDADELTELTLYSHNMLLDDFLKGGPVSCSHSLSTIASIPQIRMTRRIDGVYTQDESEMHKEFSDSVGLFSNWKKAGPVYEMPFGTLYGKKISNLITAGRCISVTDSLWDVTRVIPVCAVSGQAAGTAAAMGQDFINTDMNTLQALLIKDGAVLHEKDLQ